MVQNNNDNYVHLKLIEAGAYELPFDHENPFHDNPNYVTAFEFDKMFTHLWMFTLTLLHSR